MHVVYYLNHLCSPISPQGSPTWGRAVWSTAWRAWGPVMQESREGSPGEWSWTIHDSDGSPFYSQMVRNCMKHDEVEDLTKQWSLYSIQHWASYTSSRSYQLGQNSPKPLVMPVHLNLLNAQMPLVAYHLTYLISDSCRCFQDVHISKNVKMIDSPGVVAAQSNPKAAMALRSLQVEDKQETVLEAVRTLLKQCNKQQVKLTSLVWGNAYCQVWDQALGLLSLLIVHPGLCVSGNASVQCSRL